MTHSTSKKISCYVNDDSNDDDDDGEGGDDDEEGGGDDIYVYYDAVFVCVSVTKNDHFLLGVSCNHLNHP